MAKVGDDDTTSPEAARRLVPDRRISDAPPPIRPIRHVADVKPRSSVARSVPPIASAQKTLPDVPDEWVPSTDLPEVVASWFHVGVGIVEAEVVEAVWTGELRKSHRIAGAQPRIVQYTEELPPGLDWKRGWGGQIIARDRIVATDWTRAEVDRRTGTVGGWRQLDGTRERLPIEVSWVEAKDFATLRMWRWRREDAAHCAAVAGNTRRANGWIESV